MKLEHEDYLLAKTITDKTLKLDDENIEFHIQDSLKSFIGNISYPSSNFLFFFLSFVLPYFFMS